MKRILSLIMCMALVCVLCSCAQPESNEVMLLRQRQGENEMFYYPVSWNPETGETRQKSPIASGYSASFYLLWWDGGDYLVADRLGLSSDTIEVKSADFWASCYKDSILMHPSRGDIPMAVDHEKLVLMEGEDETREYDISGLTTPDNKYHAKDLTLAAFMMDDSKLYMLFTLTAMMDDVQLYVAQMDKTTGEIQKVSSFLAPKQLGSGTEAASANICAIEGEGLFIFGPGNVIKINPETEEVTEVFSSASFETEDAGFTIKSIGYSNGYLLVKWMSMEPFGDLYISAVKDKKVVGTIKNESKGRIFLPNV